LRTLMFAAGFILAATAGIEAADPQVDQKQPHVHHLAQPHAKGVVGGQVPYPNQHVGQQGAGQHGTQGLAPGERVEIAHVHGQKGGTQPYAAMTEREIKALSKEEIAGLLQGTGMGMALAAELNGYPGPRHVLDLANGLELTELQRERVTHAFKEMQGKAQPLGEAVVAAERELDHLFTSGTATEELVFAGTGKVAKLQGELRATHLIYHLRMVEILTTKQIADYNRMRGYSTAK
jgi:Spy/CpxP family protein refolding chaperone